MNKQAKVSDSVSLFGLCGHENNILESFCSKHLTTGAPTKEPSKGKLMTRSSFARSLTALGASVRNFSFGVSWAAVQTIAWSFAMSVFPSDAKSIVLLV